MHIFSDGELLTAEQINKYLVNNTEPLDAHVKKIENEIKAKMEQLNNLKIPSLTDPFHTGASIHLWKFLHLRGRSDTVLSINATELLAFLPVVNFYSQMHGSFLQRLLVEKDNSTGVYLPTKPNTIRLTKQDANTFNLAGNLYTYFQGEDNFNMHCICLIIGKNVTTSHEIEDMTSEIA